MFLCFCGRANIELALIIESLLSMSENEAEIHTEIHMYTHMRTYIRTNKYICIHTHKQTNKHKKHAVQTDMQAFNDSRIITHIFTKTHIFSDRHT